MPKIEFRKINRGYYAIIVDGESVGDLEKEYVPQRKPWDMGGRAGPKEGHWEWSLALGRNVPIETFQYLKDAKRRVYEVLGREGSKMIEADVPDLPWRYRDDSYYRKGSFSVEFRIDRGESGEFDTAAADPAQLRALQQLLLALRDETGLKISTFVDVWDPETDDEELDDGDGAAEAEDLDQEAPPYQSAEFVIYNKLGVTSLSKLRRFMEDHLKGDVNPRVVLIDPETNQRFNGSHFTIRYLFHEFVAHHAPDDWERLRTLMGQEDRGYGELMRSRARREGNSLRYRGHVYKMIDKQ